MEATIDHLYRERELLRAIQLLICRYGTRGTEPSGLPFWEGSISLDPGATYELMWMESGEDSQTGERVLRVYRVQDWDRWGGPDGKSLGV